MLPLLLTTNAFRFVTHCSTIKNIRSSIKIEMDSTASILFGKTRQSVLALLFTEPVTGFYLRELARKTGISPGALQKELTQLVTADLVIREQDGNRVAYRANTAHPIYPELGAIVQKTCGMPSLIRSQLEPLAHGIRLAILYGSMAKGLDHSRSDIDILIVGDLTLGQVLATLEPLEARLDRQISPRIYSTDEFRQRRTEDSFLKGVLAGPHTLLIGNLDDA